MAGYKMMPGAEKTMIDGEHTKEEYFVWLQKHLDEICTNLYCGAHWHLKAANASRRLHIRGLGRWHDCEAKGDFCSIERLEKIVGDKLDYSPHVDMQIVMQAEAFEMHSMEEFKKHFDIWEGNESELIDYINCAIHASRMIDIQIYKFLICLADEVQNERMRACMVKESFAFGGWSTHDISVKSKWIHEYFEKEHHDGEDINFNLG